VKQLSIDFQNCNGIRQLAATLDFDHGHSVAIYAPNGTMKTSFARTFAEVADDVETEDRMFPDRETVRSITDENGVPLEGSDLVVILSYDEELGPTESTSTLLVNAELRREYEGLQRVINDARDELVAALKVQSGTRKDVTSTISLTFTRQAESFYLALTRIQEEVAEQADAPFAEIPYDVVLNDKVVPMLQKAEFKSALSDYITRLNELLDQSQFFNRETFSYYNAANVTKSLGDNGYFSARHGLVLRGDDGRAVEVTSRKELDDLIGAEKQNITDDPALRKKLDVIEKELNKNVDTRAFFRYVEEHVELLPEFSNVDLFMEKVWKSYLKVNEGLYLQLLECYRDAEKRKKEIELQAASESTQWERVIEIFNERFFVPFHLTAHNRDRVVLGQENVLELDFEFDDGADRAPVEKDDLLAVLSTGEKKSLYILNVLFEVETRKASARDTLFVIDDIADSFDYKNKYAIIQYLQEMSTEPNFRLVILTHNFDFFRTLESRNVVGYQNCWMAQKNDDRVLLSQASGIRNPFIHDFKSKFFEDPMKRVASIPFLRNILEYTKGGDDPDYARLTSLLHRKSETQTITQDDLDRIFNRTFGLDGAWVSPTELVVDQIVAQARAALSADEGINFENKIVLSIAIRLVAEKHMVAAIADPTITDNIAANQTQGLYTAYKRAGLGMGEPRRVLDSVVLMTPENIHVNSFMYEPIIDMSDAHLRKLFEQVELLPA
jgi:hypothetical protein